MIEIERTNDIIRQNFLETVLAAKGIDYFVADQNMSMTEGNIGAFPRRIMVRKDDFDAARRAIDLALAERGID